MVLSKTLLVAPINLL
uniref:Uncharacterized protein n=1 Tax=Rhizophora mucronata TaxID=61149 RepID=A0A2P2PWS0_RHIMU